jgi:hypothetical protein
MNLGSIYIHRPFGKQMLEEHSHPLTQLLLRLFPPSKHTLVPAPAKSKSQHPDTQAKSNNGKNGEVNG